ncbi:MAG: hypothetical protein SOZ01_07875 [Selenomonadaceae bacterium]|nr:hypothetical protein [Selenomonadaceae bacterium]
MKDVLSLFVRRLAVSLACGTLLVAVWLWTAGVIYLLGAVCLGYVAAGVCIWTLVWRTWRAAGLSQLAAKRQMWWGLAVRLGMLTGVLLVAVKISVPVFYGTVLGFGLCYGLAMAQFLRLAWEQNKHGGRA